MTKHSQKFLLSAEVVASIRTQYDKLKLLEKYSKKLPEGLPDETIFKSNYISNYNPLYNYCLRIIKTLEELHWHFDDDLITDSDYDDLDKLSTLFINRLSGYETEDVDDLLNRIDEVKSMFVKKSIYDESFKADVLAIIGPIIRIFEEENARVK
jgi:hypothetical protein